MGPDLVGGAVDAPEVDAAVVQAGRAQAGGRQVVLPALEHYTCCRADCGSGPSERQATRHQPIYNLAVVAVVDT